VKLFPHWLDGEYVNISGEFDNRRIADYCRYLNTMLKLHALLGTEFVLNDVQIFDSWGVLALFRDDAAYKFLLDDRSFLELRVPTEPAKPGPPQSAVTLRSPFELATSGLAKAENQNWTSSVFRDDPTPIRFLAEEIFQSPRDLDPQRPSTTAGRFPAKAKELNAVRRAIHYFSFLDKPVMEMNPVKSNYYSVLGQLREMPKVVGEDRRLIETTLAFVEKYLPGVKEGTALPTRSDVLRVLDQAPVENQRKIWSNVVLAWIQASQSTIAPNGSSVGGLPDGVTPAVYLDELVDAIHPADDDQLSFPAEQVCTDISELSWEEIAKARNQTQDTQVALEKVRFTGVKEVVRPKLIEHARALAAVLVAPPGTRVPGYFYDLADCVSVYFGLAGHPWVTGGVQVAKKVVKAADSGVNWLSTRLRRGSFADVIVKAAMPGSREK
jgi:hypothetical protein